jgi:hypothetical protein
MQEYWSYNGLLLNKYEWARGLGKNSKEVTKEQSSRRREVEKGHAKLVDELEWM